MRDKITRQFAEELLQRAVKALHERTFYTPFPENPSPDVYGENADKEGQEKYQALLNKQFAELRQPAEKWVGEEESPFTGQKSGVTYPFLSPAALVNNARQSFDVWRKQTPLQRATILIETLFAVRERFFEIAHATMHTTGQSFLMSFQASGPHSADRALEAIAAGYEEQTRFPEQQLWEKPMGKYAIKLQKSWLPVPKGVALAIGCSTFPTWNTVPGLFASLVTGNPVIVKPHPKAVLPIAIVVSEIQKVLAVHNLPPAICQLAVDEPENLITKQLAEHPDIKLIDFTGSAAFGNYIENLAGKVTFTEKTGVNCIILDSVEDLEKVLQNLAFSVTLYSGQMCTTPQNFLVPEDGILTPGGRVTYAEVVEKLSAAISGLLANPKVGPHIIGAIQNTETLKRTEALIAAGYKSVLTGCEVQNVAYPEARICAPLLFEADATDTGAFNKELFGPVACIIKTKNTQQSVELASQLALQHGAISCGAYATNPEIKELIKDKMALAGTSVSFNLTGPVYVNQSAAFSDFHVTGGNPAGNASFTNPEFVIKRFYWVAFREPAAG